MLSDYGKNRVLQAIFNEGALGNELYAILHTGQNTGDRTITPTSSVATYTGYSAVSLAADDDSVFDIVDNEVRLVDTIEFPENSGSTMDITYLSICTGVTGSDAVLAVAPIKMGADWFEIMRNLTSAQISFANTRGVGTQIPSSVGTKYRAYKYINSPNFDSGAASAPNTFPDGAKWGGSSNGNLRETQAGASISGNTTAFPFFAHMHIVADIVLEAGSRPIVASYAMSNRPLLKIY